MLRTWLDVLRTRWLDELSGLLHQKVAAGGKFSVLGAALKTYQRKGEGGERGERKGEKKERKEKKKREDSKCIDFADE